MSRIEHFGMLHHPEGLLAGGTQCPYATPHGTDKILHCGFKEDHEGPHRDHYGQLHEVWRHKNNFDWCEKCKARITVGDHPECPHERPVKSKGFEPYFDHSLGQQITTPGDWNKAMRPHWENDHIVKVDDRDKSDSYYRELNQRREHRIQEERRRRQ